MSRTPGSCLQCENDVPAYYRLLEGTVCVIHARGSGDARISSPPFYLVSGVRTALFFGLSFLNPASSGGGGGGGRGEGVEWGGVGWWGWSGAHSHCRAGLGCQAQALQGGACRPFLTLGLALPGGVWPLVQGFEPNPPHTAPCKLLECSMFCFSGRPPTPIQAFVLPLT